MRKNKIANKNVCHPHTKAYFENIAGALKTGGKLTKTLLDERSKDKVTEDKRRNSA